MAVHCEHTKCPWATCTFKRLIEKHIMAPCTTKSSETKKFKFRSKGNAPSVAVRTKNRCTQGRSSWGPWAGGKAVKSGVIGSRVITVGWPPGFCLCISHCLYFYGRAKLRLARSTQHGERNLPMIPGVEQTPESGPLLEGCPELLAAILPCPSRPFVPWLVWFHSIDICVCGVGSEVPYDRAHARQALSLWATPQQTFVFHETI